MQHSLFKKEDNEKLIERINSLKHDTKPVWGSMDVAQMLAHCQAPLLVAHGEMKLKRGLFSILFGGIFKRRLTKDAQPFGRNIPTAKEFMVPDKKEFEKEKKRLIELVKRFSDSGPDKITKDPHPFFGKMTPKEWDVLQWKHLDHHLRQFGA
jgi:hypothetical protein